MSGQLAAYGRLVFDPRPHETTSGKPMTTGRLAVDVAVREGGETGEATLWLDLLAFGRVAEDLSRHTKGDLVSVAGPLRLSRFKHRESGEDREHWQVVLDSLVSARSVRPGGGRRKGQGDGRDRGQDRNHGASSTPAQRDYWPARGASGSMPGDPDPPPIDDAEVPF